MTPNCKLSSIKSAYPLLLFIYFCQHLMSCSTIKLWMGMSSFKKPEFEVSSIEVEKIEMTQIHLIVHAQIKNNNPYDIEVKDLNYNLFLDQAKLADGSIKELPKIAALTETKTKLPLSLQTFTLIEKGLLASPLSGTLIPEKSSKKASLLSLRGKGVISCEFGTIEKEFEKNYSKEDLLKALKKKGK